MFQLKKNCSADTVLTQIKERKSKIDEWEKQISGLFKDPGAPIHKDYWEDNWIATQIDNRGFWIDRANGHIKQLEKELEIAKTRPEGWDVNQLKKVTPLEWVDLHTRFHDGDKSIHPFTGVKVRLVKSEKDPEFGEICFLNSIYFDKIKELLSSSQAGKARKERDRYDEEQVYLKRIEKNANKLERISEEDHAIEANLEEFRSVLVGLPDYTPNDATIPALISRVHRLTSEDFIRILQKNPEKNHVLKEKNTCYIQMYGPTEGIMGIDNFQFHRLISSQADLLQKKEADYSPGDYVWFLKDSS